MPMFRVKPCKNCGSEWHTKFKCPYLERKGLAKIGRQGKRINSAVRKWKRQQEANHEGYFECYMCHKWIKYQEAEHVKSKVRHPELRADQTNFKHTCDDCNAKKGSRNG